MLKLVCIYIIFFFRYVYDVVYFMFGSCVEIGLKRWIIILIYIFFVIYCSKIY